MITPPRTPPHKGINGKRVMSGCKLIKGLWGRSSVGRASRWQREGREFETLRLHQNLYLILYPPDL